MRIQRESTPLRPSSSLTAALPRCPSPGLQCPINGLLCKVKHACPRNRKQPGLPHCHHNATLIGVLTLFFFSKPPMTLSMACSKWNKLTVASFARAAMSAASLHTLAMSAPLKPGVRAATRSALTVTCNHQQRTRRQCQQHNTTAMSAPHKPGVRAATCSANKVTGNAYGQFVSATLRVSHKTHNLRTCCICVRTEQPGALHTQRQATRD
jgi:hypothetical protein